MDPLTNAASAPGGARIGYTQSAPASRYRQARATASATAVSSAGPGSGQFRGPGWLPHEHVYPRVDHQVLARRGADGCEVLGLLARVGQRARSRIGVLQVAASDPGLGKPRDKFSSGKAVAVLDVSGHGHADAARDPRDGGEHLVCWRLAIPVAECRGHRAAGGRQRAEPCVGERPRAHRIPDIGQDQRRRAGVHGPQPLRAGPGAR